MQDRVYGARWALDYGSIKEMHETNELKNSSQNDRLLVTFFLFSYNQEKYIEEACKAALAQTYAPLEIIFSDDCSFDRTFELIEKVVQDYVGPHKIKLNRNQKNLGLIGHVNKSFEISSGDLIVAAAGDDISVPERVQCLADAYVRNERKPLVIHSNATKIDDLNTTQGAFVPPVIDCPMNLAELAACRSLYIGATGAWSKALYTDFGPILFTDAYEDLVLGFRAAIKDSLLYLDKPLVRYRVNVGLSAKTVIPVLKIKARIAIRIKHLKNAHDVYAQRLNDLSKVSELDKDRSIRAMLIRNINSRNKKILFYRNPFFLFLHVFSKDFIGTIRSLISEIKYLFGLINYSA